jgi:hypothetical protein
MSAIEQWNVIEGSYGQLRNAGAPVAGTTEVQTITIGGTPTAGATSGFYLTVLGYTTALILWSATNATLVANIDAALEALPPIGAAGVVTAVGTMTAGVGTITVTFSGANLALHNIGGVMSVTNALTGTSPTVAVARTTPGVDATFRGASVGQLLIDTTNTLLYENTSVTAQAPTWTKVGTQS